MTHLLSITQQQDGTYLVTGNTFPIKDTLKHCGGTWDAGRKAWIMPQEFDPSSLPQPPAPAPGVAGSRPPTSPPLANSADTGDDDPASQGVGFVAQPDQAIAPPTRRSPPQETKLIPSTNTYKVKDQIVKAGGRWVPETKEWRVPIDFDMSIIPRAEPRQSRAAAASADAQRSPLVPTGDTIEVVTRPRVIHCGLCGAEGHSKNRCQCSHCGTMGFHRPDRCPTIHPRWKFLVGSQNFHCTCNATSVCTACEYACCRDAVPVPCVCLLKTHCAIHGENCHGTHD